MQQSQYPDIQLGIHLPEIKIPSNEVVSATAKDCYMTLKIRNQPLPMPSAIYGTFITINQLIINKPYNI